MNHESNDQTEMKLKESLRLANKDQMMADVAERIKKHRRHLFKTSDCCEMSSYMNKPNVYQSG